MKEDQPTVIIDNGAAYCKAGNSGMEGPTTVFPNCICYSKYVFYIY